MTPAPGARLELAGLHRRYPGADRDALVGLDVEVPAGSCLAVLGPSGSGKTTVLRLVAGLELPDAGAVRVDGVDLAGVPPERRGMAVLSQRPLLFPHLDVADNVAFAARVAGRSRREARAEAAQQLALVGLTGLDRRRPSALSGGQAQRVALARALTSHPRVLLLDEPTTGLDSATRSEVHDLLRAVREATGTTTVLVTHDPAEAAVLGDLPGDRVAVLDAGRLHQHAPVADLYARPASLTVARLLGGRTEVPGVVRSGRHVSALGAVPVAGPEGPGVLVVRPELVGLGPPGARTGTVVDVRGLGARWLVRVEVTADGHPAATVHAEVGRRPSPGERVGVELPAGAATVVRGAGPDGSGSAG